MKNILVIFKKELKRFFTDRRMLLAMFLPGVLIYIIYSFMGNIFSDSLFNNSTTDVTYKVAYTDNFAADNTAKPKLLTVLDAYFTAENQGNKASYQMISTSSVADYKEKLKSNDVDLVIEYSANFEDTLSVSGAANNLNIFYNGENSNSENLYSTISALVGSSYNNYTQNVDLTTMKPIDGNVTESSAMLGQVIAMIVPMVTVSLLYSTVISFCPESISGEKERGTLANILLTPIKKSEYVIGKILALSIIATLSGTVSFLGLLGSLPKLMGLTSLPLAAGEIALFLLLMVSTLLLFVGLGVLVSSFANSVKEATSYLGPCSLLFMVLSFVPMIMGTDSIALAFIPIVNFSASISGLFNQTPNMALFLAITVISNLAITGLFVFLVTKIFSKEKTLLGQ